MAEQGVIAIRTGYGGIHWLLALLSSSKCDYIAELRCAADTMRDDRFGLYAVHSGQWVQT